MIVQTKINALEKPSKTQLFSISDVTEQVKNVRLYCAETTVKITIASGPPVGNK
jgi:hypothetical protein